MLRILCLFVALVSLTYAAPKETPANNVLAFDGRCTELCNAGLGGIPCGCPPGMVKNRLHNDIHAWRVEHPEAKIIYGPRRDLCPSLCAQNLGLPLCGCINNSTTNNLETIKHEDWCPICHDILYAEFAPDLWMELGCHDAELLKKCVMKENESRKKRDINQIIKLANKSEEVDWDVWCEVQCHSNNGGLACNCDMLPLSVN